MNPVLRTPTIKKIIMDSFVCADRKNISDWSISHLLLTHTCRIKELRNDFFVTIMCCYDQIVKYFSFLLN